MKIVINFNTTNKGEMMIDEEMIKKNFKSLWFSKDFDKFIGLSAYEYEEKLWLESARQTDKIIREECAEICEQYGIKTPTDCTDAIRASIKE